MVLLFDHDHFIRRDRSEFSDEQGRLRYWGIYDFAFKHRTRVFDEDDAEVFYVQKDISRDHDVVIICDSKDVLIDTLIFEEDHYLLEKQDLIYKGDLNNGEFVGKGKLEKGHLEITEEKDMTAVLMVLFSLVEIRRKD